MLSPEASKLDDVVFYGVAHDLYRALRAWNFYSTIADNAREIEERHVGQSFFGAAQQMAIDELYLMLARIFEKPGFHEIRSVPFAIQFAEKHAELLKVQNRESASRVLRRLRVSWPDQADLSDKDFTCALFEIMSRSVANLPATQTLKSLRDKRLAHHDLSALPKNLGISPNNIEILLAFGFDFLELIGETYLSGAVSSDSGPNFVVAAAARDAFSLFRLLKLGGFEPTRGWIVHERDLKRAD